MSSSTPEHAILVFIPTFENAATLPAVVEGALRHANNVLVVDDGSTDDTAAVLKAFPQVHVIRHSANKGKGAALLTGFQYALRQNFESVVVIDADGQHFPSDLPRIFKKIAENPGAIVIGARDFDAPGAGDVPDSSRFGRSFSNFWVWAETGLELPDTQSGFRAYPVRRLPLQGLTCRRYDFEIEILARSSWAGVPITSVGIGVFYPKRGERVSHFDPWKDNARLTVVHTRLVTRRIVAAIFRQDLRRLAQLPAPENKERRGAALMGTAFRFVGVSGCYLFAPLVLLLYYAAGRSARESIHEFHEALGHRRSFWRAFQNFLFFGLSLIDRLALATGRFQALRAVTVQNRPKVLEGPAILIGAHFGDWAFCGSALSEKKAQHVAVVMDLRLTPRFESLVREQGKGRFEFIDASGSGLDLILKVKGALDAGGLVCFLGDRTKPGVSEIRETFLGREASFPLGPYQLATRLKVPVYSFFCLKGAYRPRAPYVVYIDEIWNTREDVQGEQLARRFVARLEEHVRRDPRHWFNFFPFWGKQQDEGFPRITGKNAIR